MLSSSAAARLSRTRDILTDLRNRVLATDVPEQYEIVCNFPGCPGEIVCDAMLAVTSPSLARPQEQASSLADAIELIELVLNPQAGA